MNVKQPKTYVFPIQLLADVDGRWSATCPALSGCATWGHTQEDAIKNIQEAVEAYVDDMIRAGESLPPEVHPLDTPAVSVTV